MEYMNSPVAVKKCDSYDASEVKTAVFGALSLAGVDKDAVCGKKVVIKPNLLLAYPPEKATTTHPEVLYSVIEYIKTLEPKSVLVAECPGGPMSEKTLKHNYTVTGTLDAAERAGVELNYGISSSELSMPDGVTAKNVICLDVIKNADVVVNVCKSKTHSLAGVTGACKNLFGVIPGVTKFEMHARFKSPDDFLGMVCDIDKSLCDTKTVINVCDAVVGMEGNGPSGGTPKKLGCVLCSFSPFNLDEVMAGLMSHLDRSILLNVSKERGYVGRYETLGDEITPVEFKPADASLKNKFALIPPFLQPRPVIDKNICKGCSKCVESCPQKTIIKVDGKAKINKSGCIRCYCCQELCTFKAVKIKKSFIYRIIK